MPNNFSPEMSAVRFFEGGKQHALLLVDAGGCVASCACPGACSGATATAAGLSTVCASLTVPLLPSAGANMLCCAEVCVLLLLELVLQCPKHVKSG